MLVYKKSTCQCPSAACFAGPSEQPSLRAILFIARVAASHRVAEVDTEFRCVVRLFRTLDVASIFSFFLSGSSNTISLSIRSVHINSTHVLVVPAQPPLTPPCWLGTTYWCGARAGGRPEPRPSLAPVAEATLVVGTWMRGGGAGGIWW